MAFNLWKYYNCEPCIDRAWPGLTLYYEMLYNNYSVSPTPFARWGDVRPALRARPLQRAATRSVSSQPALSSLLSQRSSRCR